ncbi:MAG TPA: hypothetical protein VKS82_08120 [Streptosporangiaceae bacterium]|nr:hypothetical protein [Streptosporangiaceae bacterium]
MATGLDDRSQSRDPHQLQRPRPGQIQASRPRRAQPAPPRSRATQSGEPQSPAAEPGPAQLRTARPGVARPRPAQPGPGKPGPSRPSQPGTSRPVRPAARPAAAGDQAVRAAERPAAAGRPRTPFVLLLLALLGGGLVCLLLINTTLAQGSFQITAIQQKNASLAQQVQAAEQQTTALRSPASIAARAQQLGMRPVGRLHFLDLKNGRIYSQPAKEPGVRAVPGYTP